MQGILNIIYFSYFFGFAVFPNNWCSVIARTLWEKLVSGNSGGNRTVYKGNDEGRRGLNFGLNYFLSPFSLSVSFLLHP